MATPTTPLSPTGTLRGLWARRELRFLVVGGFNTLFALVLFTASHLLIGDDVPYLVLLVPTYGIGIPVAFTMQRLLVFDTEGGSVLVDLARYTLVQLTSVALNAVVLTGLVELLSFPVLLGQVVTLVLIVVVTYFGHLLFSFKRPAEPEETR
ncbi:MAG: GtrA family protein [Marmoricola sp.]